MQKLQIEHIDDMRSSMLRVFNVLGELVNGQQMALNWTKRCFSWLFILLVALSCAASATDYYVATWGDNSNSGDITHPWQNVSYATQQAVAGDTIYLFDGTWYNEVCTFTNSGNATHRITLTAYNGTPTLIGDGGETSMIGIKFESYMTISHLTMRDYTHTIFANTGANHSVVSDCDLGHTGGTNYGYVVKIAGQNCHYNTIENCTIHDSGWNSIQLYGNREPPNGNGIPSTHITIRNCTIYNSNEHNAIDLYGNFQYVTIENNELYDNPAGCIFDHDYPDHREYITIRDNYFHETQSIAVNLGASSYFTIYNNTFENLAGVYPIYIALNSHNFEIHNNSFYNTLSPRAAGGHNFVYDKNYINTDAGIYMYSYGASGTVKNPLGKKQVEVKYGYSAANLEFDDGIVFTAQFGDSGNPPSAYTPVRYYPDKSNCSITSTGSGKSTLTPTTYPITLRPTHPYLTASDITDTSITVTSTQQNNPTTITNTIPEFASSQVTLLVDGSPYETKASDSSGFISFDYTGSWSTSHTFSWQSGGPAPTGSVTGIVTDTDDNLITDAEVTTGAKSTQTNSDGEYTLTDLAEGDYTITASKDGYQDSSKNIRVIADDTVILDFQLSGEQEDNPPTARAGSDQTVYANTPITFDGSASTDDHGIESYVWDFDISDDSQTDATDPIIQYKYTETGIYIAKLTVTDTSGQTDSDTALITVLEQLIQKTDVSKITQPIVLDGSLSEWAGADTVTFAGSDNTATVSLTWDGNNLYLGFDITDANLQSVGTDEYDPLHTDDSIEIYLDTENDGGTAMQVDDYHFIINLNGALVDDQGTGSGKDYSWTGHIDYAIDLGGTLNDDSDTDDGYVMEVAIPWSDIGGAPLTGDVMGLDMVVNDDDGTEVQSFDWCNLASWAVPDGWGDATFIDDTAPNAPTVVSSSPTGTDVPVDSVIAITFSEEMDHPVAEDAFSIDPSVDVAFAWAGSTMTVTPSPSLEYSTIYTVTIDTGARSASGIHLNTAHIWQFTTEGMLDNPPAANAGPDRTGYANTPVTFDGSASTDDHGITSYEWDFDISDDIEVDATGVVVSHTYKPGIYIAKLTVADTSGQTDSDTVLVTVLGQGGQENNMVSITGDAAAPNGESVEVPIMVYNATGIGCAGINLSYDASVIDVVGVRQGDFTDYFGFDTSGVADGRITINTYTKTAYGAGDGLIGDVTVAYVTLEAVGDPDDQSVLDLGTTALAHPNGTDVPETTQDGMFTVIADADPPVVTDPSASQPIPDDTDNDPRWGETAQLNVTVIDDRGVASVTIDLLPIGGSSAQPMTKIVGDIWSVITNASAGTAPGTYDLQVTATDIYGNSNVLVSIPLTVMQNGDVTGNDATNIADAMLLMNYVSYQGWSIESEFVADVTGDGTVNIADAMLLANYVSYPGQYTLR